MAALAASLPTANAQWSVVSLHPAGAANSYGFAASGTQQAGAVDLGGLRAALWNGTAASWVDLHPAGASESQVRGMAGDNQVGEATVAGLRHASRWTGAAASWTDLHPFAAQGSAANTTGGPAALPFGLRHGGSVHDGTHERAALWVAGNAGWVDLHPAGATRSVVNAIFGIYGGSATREYGFAEFGAGPRAGFWEGGAQTWTSIHPLGATTSAAEAMMVGWAVFDGAKHAGRWTVTFPGPTWIDLHPAGATSSAALASDRYNHVGYAEIGGARHASFWYLTAASWADLHATLPADYTESWAEAVGHSYSTLYAVGTAYNATAGRYEAILWSRPDTCYADCNRDGFLNLADYGCHRTMVATGNPWADCNGDMVVNIYDFGCFQSKFALGCP